jgi:hypothetical protein
MGCDLAKVPESARGRKGSIDRPSSVPSVLYIREEESRATSLSAGIDTETGGLNRQDAKEGREGRER